MDAPPGLAMPSVKEALIRLHAEQIAQQLGLRSPDGQDLILDCLAR